MAIGAHELLLIVRAQNQASAALGRIGRDVKRLQNLRDIELQRGQLVNRLARNNIQQMGLQTRMQSIMSEQGRARLQYEQSVSRNLLQQTNVANRIANLEVRRTSLARAGSNIEIQRLRLQHQELTVESNLEKIESRRAAIQNTIGSLGTQALRNLSQQESMKIKAYSLETQLMQRQMAASKAGMALALAQKEAGGESLVGSPVHTRAQIANRRVTETQMQIGAVPGQQKVLASSLDDVAARGRLAQKNLKELDVVEKQLAKDSEILAERHRSLGLQLANVQARTNAVAGVEKELQAELKIVANQLNIVNAAWKEQGAVVDRAIQEVGILAREEGVLNAQLAEQDALLRRQGLEKYATGLRAVSHAGRVMQMAGLVTTAAFSAMAVSAAKFNTEAIRVSTQTGSIGQSADKTVANAGRISKSIEQLMQVIPADQHQMTDALYNIYSSMNVTFGGGTKLLKLFGQVWVAGGMQGTIDGVADALITLGNNWKISGDDMASWNKLAASTLATVRFGRLTVEQYTQTMNQLAPAFAGANQSIEQMNGALAFLTRLLPSQRVTAAGIARMMETLQRFAAHPVAGFEGLAKSIVDTTGSLKPLDQVIGIMIQKFPKLQTSGVFLTNFFKTISNQQGTVQARRAFQAFVHQFELYQQTLKNTTGDTQEFDRSLKAMEQSTGVKWATFVNQMRALALEIGTAVIPALTKMAAPLVFVAKWFNNLSDSTKRQVSTFAAIAGVFALVGGTTLTFVGSLAAMVVSLRILKSEAGTLLRVFGLGAEAGASTPMVLGLLAAITALGVILAADPHLITQFTNAMGGMQNTILALTAAFAAFSVAKFISGLAAVETEAAVATGMITKLRLALLGIASVPFIISIGVNILKSKDKAITKFLNKLMPGLGGGQTEMLSPSQAMTQALTTTGPKQEVAEKILDAQGLTKEYQKRAKAIKAAITNAQKNAKPTVGGKGIFDIPLTQMFSKDESGNMEAFTSRQAGDAAVAAAKITKASFMSQLKTVAGLQSTYQSSGTLAASNKYNNALAALNKEYNTKNYQSYISDYLSKVQSADKKALSAAAKDANNASKFSNSQVMKLARQADALQKLAQKTADPKIWEQYYAIQKKLQDGNAQDQLSVANSVIQSEDALKQKKLDNAKTLHDKQVQLAKDAAAKIKQVQEEATQQVKSATDSLLSYYQNQFQQYQGQLGTLFNGPFMNTAIMQNKQQYGFSASPKDLLADLFSSVKQFEKFQSSISGLRKRGAPDELISQIQQMGPESQKQLNTLARLKPGDFKKYVDIFKRGQADADKAAKADLNRQLDKWNAFGKNVSLAIITGIKSQTPGLENILKTMIQKMFPNLASRAATGSNKSNVVDKAFKQFPGIDKYKSLFSFKQSGASPKGYQSESYQKGESESFDPLHRAIQLFGKKNSPSDVAGEVISHFLVKGLDPTLTRLYKQFAKTITPDSSAMRFLKRDFKTQGDGRTFKQYEQMSGIPALLRGGLFNQLDSGDVKFNKAQKQILANMKLAINTPSNTKPSQSTTTHKTTNFHIHPTQKGESWETMLRRAYFVNKNLER